ncbi:MAG TPA: hypothetical protein VEK07_17185 [Polyangiaceae bacterium]|nr:hypothetical protein [Polyangiaceae bacterium]
MNRMFVSALLGFAGASVYACSSSTSSTPSSTGASSPMDASTSGNDGSAADAVAADAPPADALASDVSTPDAPADASAVPLCSSLPGTVVYIESGDTQEPLLKALGRQLRDNANITLAYQLTGSCTLTPNLYEGTPIPKNTNLLYIPSTAENPSWTTSDPELTCTTSPSAGTAPDLGISALFPSSCELGGPPAGIGTFNGPIQAYTFIVPTAEFTTQTSISAEEAYYAFGDGANNPVTFGGSMEWNVPSEFFLRPATKSTLVATAFNIGLTAAQMTLALADGGSADGRNLESSSDDVLSAVAASTSLQAIGILGDEVYDTNRGKGVNVLAFEAFGQSEAYYPDSTTTSFDKQNIRDGHYTLWSPTVYITPIDNTGAPVNPTVKYVVDLVVGNQGAAPPGGLTEGGAPIDGLGVVVSVSLTPNCAMQVQRAGDGLPFTPYTPAEPCTCDFLSKIPNAATLPASCVPCSASNPCETGGCFNGYCEVPPTPATTGVAGCDIDDGSYPSIIDACTDATAISKAGVVYPATADGGLAPLNP